MRDLAEKWPPMPEWDTAVIDTGTLRIRTLRGLEQRLVSGDLAAWALVSNMAGSGVGYGEIARRDRYMVRIARDRALAVSKTPLDIADGWHGQGFAVSVLDAGLHVFEIAGPGTAGLLARATTLDPNGTSSSAAMLFADVHALVYRHDGPETVRVHVDRGLAPYLWEWCLSCRDVPPAISASE